MKNLIVIPAYNEEEALPGTIKDLECLPDDYEIVVVNDGSPDGTARVAEDLAKTCKLKMHTLHLPLNGGIGVAVQAGYRFAARYGGYEYVLQFDADGQHEAAYIEPIVEACRTNGLDLCVGSRFLTPREGDFQSTFTRRLGIRMLATQIRLLSGFKATDPTSGFRCAGPRVWRSFAQRYPDDYPEPESIFWCARNKLKIGEIPVRMRERQGGQSSIRTLQTTYYMIKVMGAIFVDGLRTKELTEP